MWQICAKRYPCYLCSRLHDLCMTTFMFDTLWWQTNSRSVNHFAENILIGCRCDIRSNFYSNFTSRAAYRFLSKILFTSVVYVYGWVIVRSSETSLSEISAASSNLLSGSLGDNVQQISTVAQFVICITSPTLRLSFVRAANGLHFHKVCFVPRARHFANSQ